MRLNTERHETVVGKTFLEVGRPLSQARLTTPTHHPQHSALLSVLTVDVDAPCWVWQVATSLYAASRLVAVAVKDDRHVRLNPGTWSPTSMTSCCQHRAPGNGAIPPLLRPD